MSEPARCENCEREAPEPGSEEAQGWLEGHLMPEQDPDRALFCPRCRAGEIPYLPLGQGVEREREREPRPGLYSANLDWLGRRVTSG